MAKPRPKKRDKDAGGQLPSPASPSREAAPTAPTRVLPMQLKVGDRFTDETGEWEVIARPYTIAGGKNARARVQRVGAPDTTELRLWAAHERIAVRRP